MTTALADAVPRHDACIAWTWGTTAAERAHPFPCDRWLPGADDALFRAVDVDAPAAVAFRWLCQLRVAPYSYDWIDNFGRQSPRALTRGLDPLAVGQRVMSFFEIVEFEHDSHVTAVTRSALFGEIAASYVVVRRGEATCRLVVKLLVRHPPAPVGWMTRALLPWGDLVMMRKQLLTLKSLAERQAGDRARERASWPTGSGASEERRREAPSTARAPRRFEI
jgi:hypothetical protein